MKLKQYLKEADQLEMQLAEPNTPLAQAFNGQEKLIKKIGNIERYKGQFGSFRYIFRDEGNIVAAVQGVLKPPILSNIFVANKYRRKGVASKLFAQAKKDIKGLKVSTDKSELGKKFFNEGINESKELNSNKSGKWDGLLYRAINTGRGDAALGTGLYLTPNLVDAKIYGKTIKTFQTKPIKVLGVNSREYESIRKYVNSDEGFDKYFDEDSIAQMIRLEAESRGYEAIYGGGQFGIVVFNPKKTVKEVK